LGAAAGAAPLITAWFLAISASKAVLL